MGENTAKAQRKLADAAKKAKEQAAREGDMLGAMHEQYVETDYRRRAAKSKKDRGSW